jgi:hypothetical protein
MGLKIKDALISELYAKEYGQRGSKGKLML